MNILQITALKLDDKYNSSNLLITPGRSYLAFPVEFTLETGRDRENLPTYYWKISAQSIQREKNALQTIEK